MTSVPPTPIQRRFPRLRAVDMQAVVLARRNQHAQFSVESLSAGGALLVGGLALVRTESIRVMLEGPDGHPIDVAARVLRMELREDGLRAVAVQFVHVSADAHDRIRQLVSRMLELEGATRLSSHP